MLMSPIQSIKFPFRDVTRALTDRVVSGLPTAAPEVPQCCCQHGYEHHGVKAPRSNSSRVLSVEQAKNEVFIESQWPDHMILIEE